MSSANRSHRAFINKGISRLCKENREAGLKLNLEIYLFFYGKEIGFNCLYRQAVLDLTKMKKLSAGCHWIIHKELISAKVYHDQ